MKKLKQILFGTVGMFPLWVGYFIVGGLLSSLSSQGINGDMGPWQITSAWPHYFGLVVWLLAIPGFLVWLYSITVGQIIKRK